MVYIIVLIVVIVIVFFLYSGYKGSQDIENVEKLGGLRIKYEDFIDQIMARNSNYQIRELNSNNIELTNTGMIFKLIEIDKKLQVTWNWNSFGTGKTYRLQWKFDENQDQKEMYEILNEGMTIQTFIDGGMTKNQAEDWLKVSMSTNEIDQQKLAEKFSKKHPELWSKITG